MTNCIRCNQNLERETNFCPNCGEDQSLNEVTREKSNASFLIVLCTLTIIGSIFTIARAYLYEMVAMMDSGFDYVRGWIYAGSGIGTLIGAVLMIQRKLLGLYVYSIFQVIYIITVIVASFSYGNVMEEYGDEINLIASAIAMFFIIPSLAFLGLYWTNMVRKHLN
jgi:hypothetical protein